MAVEQSKDYLDVKALIILFIITLVWGFNHPSIKYVNQVLLLYLLQPCAPLSLRFVE
jgi:hypothetical protein